MSRSRTPHVENSTTEGATSLHDLPRSILDHLSDGCQLVDEEFRYLYVNESAARHGKTTPSALVGLTMMEVYPGIETTDMFAVLRDCMQTRKAARLENEFIFPDQSKGWFDLRFEPVPEGVAILSVDITERKRTELAVLRNLRAVMTLHRCNQALAQASDEVDFIRRACRLLVEEGGYALAWVGLLEAGAVDAATGSSIATHGMHAAAPLEEPLPLGEPIDRVASSGQPLLIPSVTSDALCSIWHELARRHGWASCTVLPLDGDKTRIGVLTLFSKDENAAGEKERAILDDIATELSWGIRTLRDRIAQRHTLEELADERSRNRSIQDRLPHATFVWKQTDAGFSLIDFNDAAKALTNDLVTQRMGRGPESFGEEIPHLREDLRQCMETRRTLQREVTADWGSAETPRRLVLSYRCAPPDMCLLHAEDVTNIRRAEEQTIVAQRLEAVSRLAGSIAHDFNNLLSIVLAYAELALQQLPETSSVRIDLEEIRGAGQRATQLTRQLLAFSRKQILDPRQLDLNETMSALEARLRRLLGNDIQLDLRKGSDLGAVTADPGLMEQVIMNLAVNAKEAMPDGGTLVIETDNVDLDSVSFANHTEVEPGPYVRISVSDTGIGMDESTLDHIFEPFFTTKSKSGGTGLGLSTVYGTVKQSKGHVWVSSQLGRGTKFEIYLPRVDASQSPTSSRDPLSWAKGTETVLVVEDDQSVRAAAERILGNAGYHVLSASDGSTALRLGESYEGQIDLLFTDVVMPGMCGQRLAERLQERRPSLKVLYCSGYTDDAIRHRRALAPGTPYVSKPFSTADLMFHVRRVLDE